MVGSFEKDFPSSASAESAATDAPEQVGPFSDEDLLEAYMPDSEFLPTKNERESVEAALIAHYGGQLFQYKQYGGTVADMIAMCPAVSDIIGGGFDQAIMFLEQYTVDALTLDDKTGEDDEDKDAEKHEDFFQLSDKNENDENEAVVEDVAPIIRKSDEPADKSATAKDGDGQEGAVEQSSLVVLEGAGAAGGVKESRLSVREKVSEDMVFVVPRRRHEAKDDEVIAPEHESSIIEVPAVEPDAIEAPDITPESIENVEGVAKQAMVAARKLDDVPQEYEALAPVPELPPLRKLVEVEEAAEDAVMAPSVTLSLQEETMPIEPIEENKTPLDVPAVTYKEQWSDLADAEAPMEVLFETVIQELGSEADSEQAPDLPEAHSLAESIEDRVESLVEAVESIFDTPVVDTGSGELEKEIAIAGNELLGADGADLSLDDTGEAMKETPSKKVAELQMFLAAVASSKEHVQLLYTATTKEECRAHLEQIVAHLAVVFQELGYDTPERIVRAYLETHSPEELRFLVERLEVALRKRLQQEMGQKNKATRPIIHHRHQRLEKFIAFVMNSLALKPASTSEADFAA